MSRVSPQQQSLKKSNGLLERRLKRVVDVNLNRALEGLRVCEDFCRFIVENKVLTKKVKRLRHGLVRSLRKFSLTRQELIIARNIRGDSGKESIKSEKKRENLNHVVLVNLQRVKESLRVLEEYLKISYDTESIKKLRYQLYEVEKDIFKCF